MAGAVLATLGAWVRPVVVELDAVGRSCWDRRVSWWIKGLALVVLVFSPFDLVPDPIPIVGYVGDLLVLPGGTLLVRALLPTAVLAEYRVRAGEAYASWPDRRLGVWAVAMAVGLTTGGLIVAWVVPG